MSQSEQDAGNDIYWKINDFYSAYLRYPRSVDELSDYLWYIINGVNDFKYISFNQYLDDSKNVVIKETNTMLFLQSHKDEIKMREEGDKFKIIYKGQAIDLERNICNEIKNIFENSALLNQVNTCNTFGYDGKLTQQDYSDDFSNLLDSVREKHVSAFANNSHSYTYNMFRYHRGRGIHAVCSIECMDSFQTQYLEELKTSLDTFVRNRNIDTMTFLIKLNRII